ncbi:tetratricopeptide repeat protein [Telmatospirillum sp. J64-1]|uniref:tetratricopeptide repeat protein n=1 Tax=Telmatospirillum sp. J64-1 TaxID=2502183 RepID=UPI002104C588|nr:tetratricopeptide repeat protein [Telmatospirillum sp. J64-1]
MDDLFLRLQTTSSEQEAHILEMTILHTWTKSGIPEVDTLTYQGLEAIDSGDLELAQHIFDRVVLMAPHFAEGWNLRASVHYLKGDYRSAVGDIERVLKLEPRHFGALAGLGQIFLSLGHDRAALKAFDMALALNPHLASARTHALELRQQIAGMAI